MAIKLHLKNSQALLMNSCSKEKPQKQGNVEGDWRHGIHDSRIHHRYDSVVELFWRQLECPQPWRERMSLWFMPRRWECLSWGVKKAHYEGLENTLLFFFVWYRPTKKVKHFLLFSVYKAELFDHNVCTCVFGIITFKSLVFFVKKKNAVNYWDD